MRLILIRHGQTPENVLGLLDTAHPGPGLTALGTTQAQAIPNVLRGQSIDAIFASTLVRTQLTAEPLATERGLTVQTMHGVHETEAGSLEGFSDRASVHTYLETMFARVQGSRATAMPDAADGSAFVDRFDADIARITTTAQTAVVLSHGAAIRVWTGMRAGNIEPRFAEHNVLDNTGVVELTG